MVSSRLPSLRHYRKSRSLRRKYADDRARDLPSARVTPRNELPQCFAQAVQVRQPGLHDRKLSSRELTGLPATAPVFQREQIRNFREREAEILGPLDEPDPLHAVFGISPNAVQGPLRFRDQAPALIVADGLDGHTGGTRKPPDGEVSIHEFHSLTPYYGTAIRIRLSTFAARTATRRVPA